jgi:DNA-binding Lrp family transcriptional regulator
MTNAIVLIEAERDALSTLGGELADIEGVAEAYSVTGEWDFVAIVRVPDHEQLAGVVTANIGGLSGVVRTQTMVAFGAYSRHDLESLFAVGE